MLGEENLYMRQDLKKGSSASMGFKFLLFLFDSTTLNIGSE